MLGKVQGQGVSIGQVKLDCRDFVVVVVVKYVLLSNRYGPDVHMVTEGGPSKRRKRLGALPSRGPHGGVENSERGEDGGFSRVVWADKNVEVTQVEGKFSECLEARELHSDEATLIGVGHRSDLRQRDVK